jgi:hypothetical protein
LSYRLLTGKPMPLVKSACQDAGGSRRQLPLLNIKTQQPSLPISTGAAYCNTRRRM